MSTVQHTLKTWIEPFTAVWEGRKRYEVRQNDRNFQSGDVLVLREWDRFAEKYTGRVVRARVGYTTEGAWGVPEGIIVMSIDVIETEQTRHD